jgi:hypothetical protein
LTIKQNYGIIIIQRKEMEIDTNENFDGDYLGAGSRIWHRVF